MKIALYIGTGILALLALMLFGAGMESVSSDPGAVQPLFGTCSALLGILASWWLCALAGEGLWTFAARSVGFALCLHPLFMLFGAPDLFSPVMSVIQTGAGCSLLTAAPRFAPVRMAQGFLGGVLLLVGMMAALGLLPEALWGGGGLWGGLALSSLGCALLLVRRAFTPLLVAMNVTGSFIMLTSLVLFTQHGEFDNLLPIILLTLALIVGGTFILFPLTLERSTLFKVVGKAEGRSLDDLYRVMKECDTVLGTPWMCSLPLVGRVILFGPNANGASIYFAKYFGHVTFGFLQTTLWLRPDPENAWRLERPATPPQDRQGIWAYSLELLECNSAMVEAVRGYLAGGTFTAPPRGLPAGTLYTFDEDFRIVSQSFAMQTMDGTPLYTIDAPLPFMTFTIRDAIDGTDVLVVKKRFLRMRQQYEFFWHGKEYGTLAKQLDLVDDIFTMSTPDGLLTMQEVHGAVGSNYTVRMEQTIIGSIAGKLNPSLTNLVFDNYIIHVREKKYTPLLGALGAMAARERARDRAETIRSWTR